MTAQSTSAHGPMPLWTRLTQAPPGTSWSGIAFALRTTAASLIALYIAFLINLDSPKWAAMTVWIVAQGSRGMTLSKARYRVLGTFTGTGIAVSLTALFAQAPELLLCTLAVWVGLCTGVATALRNFRAYGAVLAGYTAAIITLDAAATPSQIFDVAEARLLYILLGIGVEATLSSVLAPSRPLDDVRAGLDAYIRQAAGICARALTGEAAATAALQRLFAKALALDTTAEYAASASTVARGALGHVRAAASATLAQLAAAHSLRDYLSRHDGSEDAFLTESAAVLRAVAQGSVVEQARIATLRGRLGAAYPCPGDHGQNGDGPLFLHDRLDALLSSLQTALVRQALLARLEPPPSHLDFAFHIDRIAALHNAVRAVAAVLLASTAWVLTAAPTGSGFVTIVSVVCALFATRDDPVAAGLGFLKGTGWAFVASAICNFALMPMISGFPLLAAVVSLFMVPAGIAMRHPRTAAPAASFAIFFWDLVGPSNDVRTEAAGFFNGGMTLLAGIACGTLAFALLFPPNVQAVRRRLHGAIRHDLALIGSTPGIWTSAEWFSRTADRFGRQLAAEKALPSAVMDRDMAAMLAALTIGAAAMELDRLAQTQKAAARPIRAVLRRLASADPQALARAAKPAAAHLVRQARHADSHASRALHRGGVLLQEIAREAIEQAAFLKG
ncbi:FUSC family protein [Labrys sp. ZIDIC5]|uniref:FUSC family protein n=1 Tax=Labrys sedimenti TaxID=3106036 RepID=UPI002ACAA1D7|nr:FUSC family protein [Labrys sp. ZIDIC5]MDZ5450718.1 FUSC family protein [Labrys sp. ZIDIC5]